MKKLFFIISLYLVVSACSGQSKYQKAIVDYLETEKGVRTDLKIKFLDFDISDITVADSILYYQEKYTIEKEKKIKDAKASVKHWQNAIDKQKGKNTPVSKALISDFKEKLKTAESNLKSAQDWSPDYLSKYEGLESSKTLAKKVKSRFTFLNPRLQTRQEINAIFILSANGEKCHKMIKQ